MASVMQIDDLVAEWQKRYEQGEYVSPGELCSGCPELTPEVVRRIEEIENSPAFITRVPEDGSAVSTMMQAGPLDESPSTLVFQQRHLLPRCLEVYHDDHVTLPPPTFCHRAHAGRCAADNHEFHSDIADSPRQS